MYLSPDSASRSAVGVEHGPPKALAAPKPTSSSNTMPDVRRPLRRSHWHDRREGCIRVLRVVGCQPNVGLVGIGSTERSMFRAVIPIVFLPTNASFGLAILPPTSCTGKLEHLTLRSSPSLVSESGPTGVRSSALEPTGASQPASKSPEALAMITSAVTAQVDVDTVGVPEVEAGAADCRLYASATHHFAHRRLHSGEEQLNVLARKLALQLCEHLRPRLRDKRKGRVSETIHRRHWAGHLPTHHGRSGRAARTSPSPPRGELGNRFAVLVCTKPHTEHRWRPAVWTLWCQRWRQPLFGQKRWSERRRKNSSPRSSQARAALSTSSARPLPC